jgi:transcriptional regulator with XRE-family HTH domain
VNKQEHNAIIAANIRANLRERHISQKDFAAAIGIAPSTLTDYLKLRTLPSHGVVQKMADFFGIEKSDLDTYYKSANRDLATLIDEADSYRGIKLDDPAREALKNVISDFFASQH